jgi:hypothetical protein
LKREAGHPVYMMLFGSGAAIINWLRLRSWRVVKESPDQVMKTLYLIMNSFLLFIMELIHFLILFSGHFIWDA